MELYDRYVTIFKWCTLLAVVALVIPAMQIVYFIVFLVATAQLVFVRASIASDSEYSTNRHLESFGRLSVLNLFISAYLVVAALFFAVAPLHKAVVTFGLWGALAVFIYVCAPAFTLSHQISLVADYVATQTGLSLPTATSACYILWNHQSGDDIEVLRRGLKLTDEEAHAAVHYFNRYIEKTQG